MPYLSDFNHVEAYSNQVEIPGIASIIHEDSISQATYGNHCELSATTILAVYNDTSTSKGMMKIGTRVSDFAIEWGTAVEFVATACAYIIPVRISDTKWGIVYQLVSDTKGYIMCGTVAGTVPTKGTVATFKNAAGCIPIGANLWDTEKVLICYANTTTNGQCIVAVTTNINLVTFGAEATFVATTDITAYTTLTQLAVHSTTLASVVYRESVTYNQVVTLSLSGTTVTPNTAGKAYFGGAGVDTRYYSIGALSATSFVVAYTDVTDTYKGNAQIGTISGTTITAGASEYTFDTSSTAKTSTIAIISSDLFAVVVEAGLVLKININKVAGTVITAYNAVTITGSAGYLYPNALNGVLVALTYTKSGQLTFSYATSVLNQFVCGMISQNYTTIEAVPMCVKVAEALTGEQIELSSVYFKSNKSVFKNIATVATSLIGNLYLNGTLSSDIFATTSDSDIVDTAEKKSHEFNRANNPIILTAGQSLYASIDTQQGSSPKKGSCTVFGLLRSI